MRIKKCCIIIPELSKKYWLFVFFIIGSLFRKMAPSCLSDYALKLKKNKIEFNEERREIYFDIVCNVASDLLTGILYYISKKFKPKKPKENKTKKKLESKNNKKNLEMELIVNTNRKKNIKFFVKILFAISFIDFICQILLFGNCIIQDVNYFNDNSDKKTTIHNPDHLYSFLVIDIVSRYIFSLLILKTYFYSHHYLSFLLNFIATIFLLYTDLNFKISEYSKIYVIMIILQYILYSLEDILNKVALNNLFINPEALLFYKGLFSSVYLFIFTIIAIIFFDLRLPDFNKAFIANIICRTYFILFNIIRSYYIVKVIDVFSSQHISFLRVFETIILFIFYKCDSFCKKNITKNDPNTNIYDNYFDLSIIDDFIEAGAFLILFVSSLIHNEIIILNCEKFKKNTIYFLNIEADKEKPYLILNSEGNLNDNNNDNSIDKTQTISSINEISLEKSNSF